jgi:His-Xaa-Ser system protein HxsD
MTSLDGFPPELVSADLADQSVTVTVDGTLYPLDAVYGAAYVLIDRAYVLLDKTGDRYRITVTPKKPEADVAAQLRPLVGELASELLACAWRVKIQAENRALIESVTMRSMGGAMGAPSLDDLESFDFSSEAFEDPLGIAMSWEEKYGKKSPPAAGEGPPKKDEPKGEKA